MNTDSLHNMVRELAENIYKEHGICLQTVTILWRDESTVGETRMATGEIVIRTQSGTWSVDKKG